MRLELDIENCYGISQLQYDFDLSRSGSSRGVYSVYAPNGTLKTSLAKTFKDVMAKRDSSDEVYPERPTKRIITIDGSEIQHDQVLVIESYDESYSSKQLSTLLVNDALKQEYEQALKEIEEKQNILIKELAKVSGKQAACLLVITNTSHLPIFEISVADKDFISITFCSGRSKLP